MTSAKPVHIEYDIHAIDLAVIAYLQQCREEWGWMASEITFLIGSRNNQEIEAIEDPSLKLAPNARIKRKTGHFALSERQVSVYDLETFNTLRLIFGFALEACFPNPYFDDDLLHVLFSKVPDEHGAMVQIQSLGGTPVEYTYRLQREDLFVADAPEAQTTFNHVKELYGNGYFKTPQTALDILLDLREAGKTARPYYLEQALRTLTGKGKEGGKLKRKRTAGIRLEYEEK